MAHKIVFPPNCREGSVQELINGLREGFPLCCIAQYVNDDFNVETWESANQRVTKFSKTARCHYVLCWDCAQ